MLRKPEKIRILSAIGLLVAVGCWLCVWKFFWRQRLITFPLKTSVPSVVQAQSVIYSIPEKKVMSVDPLLLKARGINPDLGFYFQEKSRFLPGMHRVSLTVNGRERAKIQAEFDAEGQLCLDEALLSQAHITLPSRRASETLFFKQEEALKIEKLLYSQQSGFQAGVQAPGNRSVPVREDDRSMHNASENLISRSISQIQIRLIPSQQHVELMVPPSFLESKRDKHPTEYQVGGIAGLVNYDIWVSKEPILFGNSPLHYANVEWGFNVGNWLFRTRQTHVKSSSVSKLTSLYTYLQRTFEPYQATIQLGHTAPNSNLFFVPGLQGIQVFSDQVLRRNNIKTEGLVSGVAEAPARIEVKQSGILIYSTLVPAGPFSLRHLALINNTELEVSLFEENRPPRSFTVPVEQMALNAFESPTGFSVAIGVPDSIAKVNTPSCLVMGEGHWRLSPSTTLTAGVLAYAARQSVGMQLALPVPSKMQFNVGAKLSFDSEYQQLGMQGELQWKMQLMKGLSATLFASQQTAYGYHAPLAADHARLPLGDRLRYGGSLSWRHASLGVGSVGYTQRMAFEGSIERRFTFAWTHHFKQLSLSLNAEWQENGLNRPYQQIYLRASLPLSRQVSVQRCGLYSPGSACPRAFDIKVSDRFSEYFNYQVSTEIAPVNPRLNYSAQLNLTPRYLKMGVYHRNTGDQSYGSAYASGAVAFHRQGLSFAPDRIEDTFAFASVGGLSGIQIQTPRGKVWTGPAQVALIPAIAPYTSTSIRVLTSTLPRYVDLKNGCQTLQLARGSVSTLHFDAIKTQRVLLTVVGSDDIPLPKGSAVFDAQDNFITLVGDRGLVFLSDSHPQMRLHVKMPMGKVCQVQLSPYPLDQTLSDRYYARGQAVCR